MNTKELRCSICQSAKLVDLGDVQLTMAAPLSADGQKVHVPDDHLLRCEHGHESIYDLTEIEAGAAH